MLCVCACVRARFSAVSNCALAVVALAPSFKGWKIDKYFHLRLLLFFSLFFFFFFWWGLAVSSKRLDPQISAASGTDHPTRHLLTHILREVTSGQEIGQSVDLGPL